MFIDRLKLKNYRSIAACDLRLGSITVLVGANGAGKSNIVDALRLVADALRTSLTHALNERGGIAEVRRRSAGHPTHFSIELSGTLTDVRWTYSFTVGAQKGGGHTVERERCQIGGHEFDVHKGVVRVITSPPAPPTVPDELFLLRAASDPRFRGLFLALGDMGFYNFAPEVMRELQPPSASEILRRDGSNLASVLQRLGAREHEQAAALLAVIAPGVHGFRTKLLGNRLAIEFEQSVEGARNDWTFPASNMSDGTLRALGILVALAQPGVRSARVPLVAIEEPEAALHPAAAAALMTCLLDAGERTQIIVTSHSPELLEAANLDPACIVGVEARGGTTYAAGLDESALSAVREGLYSGGELLRAGQLYPDSDAVPIPKQLVLFADQEADA